MHKLFLIQISIAFYSCTNTDTSKKQFAFVNEKTDVAVLQNKISDIVLPEGYISDTSAKNSFTNWLLNLPLKTDKTVYLFDGTKKVNQSAQFAVLNISVGTKNLQQCADAVMRLRAEYLFEQKHFDSICFIDNDKKLYKFDMPYTHEHLLFYLQQVFGMCGSASLSKQLKQKNNFAGINAGDVLIKGGFPGHAVMVIATAQNKYGKKIYLLAQSYMPAQNIHVLNNFTNQSLSPWYEIPDGDIIETPEFVFTKSALKRW